MIYEHFSNSLAAFMIANYLKFILNLIHKARIGNNMAIVSSLMNEFEGIFDEWLCKKSNRKEGNY